MRRQALSILLGVGLLGLASAAGAQETKTIQGEVADPGLYLREGRHGTEVEDVMYDAVDGGQTLALLEEGTQTVYLLLANEAGEDPNELVYEYVGRRVKATGTVYERGGLKGLVLTSVEPLDQPPASETPPEANAAVEE